MLKITHLLVILLLAFITACAPRQAAPPPSTSTPAPTQPATALPAAPTSAPSPTRQPPTAAPSPTLPPSANLGPYIALLRGATYPLDLVQAGSAALVEGEFRQPAAPGSAAETVVTLYDAAAGDLNGDGTPDAAAILTVDGGGSGTFYYLYPALMEDSTLRVLPPDLLGDRIRLVGLEIAAGKIIVQAVVPRANGPLCCPSTLTTFTYTLAGETLNRSQQAEKTVELLAPGLLNVTWQWKTLEGADSLDVDRAGAYTLRFLPDGTYAVTADCNSGSGNFLVDGKTLVLFPGSMTRAMCAEGSLDARFLASLWAARTFKVQEGYLTLDLKLDQGRITFRAE